jgi:thiosulfate reductase cytochrome b subunit
MSAGARRARPQPAWIRVAHWLHAPLLAVMGGSGLQILAAYPALGPRGAPYGWYPFADAVAPAWLRVGGWLAGARHVHFAFAWPLVVNGGLYLAYLAVSGEWRRRLFLPRRDARGALATLAAYARLRAPPATGELYNGLQRLAYTSALLLGALVVLTGLAIYKPVQLAWLVALFGGYDGARAAHLLALALLALFTLLHVVLVALHPKRLLEMVSGGRRE